MSYKGAATNKRVSVYYRVSSVAVDAEGSGCLSLILRMGPGAAWGAIASAPPTAATPSISFRALRPFRRAALNSSEWVSWCFRNLVRSAKTFPQWQANAKEAAPADTAADAKAAVSIEEALCSASKSTSPSESLVFRNSDSQETVQAPQESVTDGALGALLRVIGRCRSHVRVRKSLIAPTNVCRSKGFAAETPVDAASAGAIPKIRPFFFGFFDVFF
jgi:hypothetical protein